MIGEHIQDDFKIMLANCICTTADEGASGECVSQEELTAVKTAMAVEMSAVRSEMERRVDQLHSQLHYWQNVTVNILKDHYSSLDTSSMLQLWRLWLMWYIGAGSECISVEDKAAVLESTVLNITQSSK